MCILMYEKDINQHKNECKHVKTNDGNMYSVAWETIIKYVSIKEIEVPAFMALRLISWMGNNQIWCC